MQKIFILFLLLSFISCNQSNSNNNIKEEIKSSNGKIDLTINYSGTKTIKQLTISLFDKDKSVETTAVALKTTKIPESAVNAITFPQTSQFDSLKDGSYWVEVLSDANHTNYFGPVEISNGNTYSKDLLLSDPVLTKGKITLNISYTGNSSVKQLKAILLNKNENPPVSEALQTILIPETATTSAVTFPQQAITTELENGNYYFYVYGDTDLNDGTSVTDSDPRYFTGLITISNGGNITQNITLEDKVTDNLACFDQTCRSSNDCNCDALYCVDSDSRHGGVTKINVCTTTACNEGGIPCPNGMECSVLPTDRCHQVYDKNGVRIKSYCVYRNKKGEEKVSFKVNYSGKTIIKKIAIGLFKTNKPKGIPIRALSVPLNGEEKRLTFPYTVDVDGIDDGKYYAFVFGDVDTTDGIRPQKIDLQTKEPIEVIIDSNKKIYEVDLIDN